MPHGKYLNGQLYPFGATSFEGKHTLLDNTYSKCTFVVAKMPDFCINAFVQGQAIGRLRDREFQMHADVTTGPSLIGVVPCERGIR